jgi:hypothetical protein
MTFGAVVFLLFGFTVIATSLPAWRASRIDPIRTLRAERAPFLCSKSETALHCSAISRV